MWCVCACVRACVRVCVCVCARACVWRTNGHILNLVVYIYMYVWMCEDKHPTRQPDPVAYCPTTHLSEFGHWWLTGHLHQALPATCGLAGDGGETAAATAGRAAPTAHTEPPSPSGQRTLTQRRHKKPKGKKSGGRCNAVQFTVWIFAQSGKEEPRICFILFLGRRRSRISSSGLFWQRVNRSCVVCERRETQCPLSDMPGEALCGKCVLLTS